MIKRIEHITAQIASLPAVVKDAEFASKKELAQLREIKGRYDAFKEKMKECDNNAAARIIKAARKDYQENPTDDKFAKLSEMESDMGRLREHFANLLGNLKAARRGVVKEALPLVTQILVRVRARVEAELEKVRAEEAKYAQSYGIAPETGVVSAAIHNLLVSLDGSMPLLSSNPFVALTPLLNF
jgi:predicted nuclease with TOPRIM domain